MIHCMTHYMTHCMTHLRIIGVDREGLEYQVNERRNADNVEAGRNQGWY